MLNSKKNIILSGIIGNVLEQYDNIIFGFMALYISAAFFPRHHALNNLLYVFYVFFIGYAMRPLGSIVFGYVSDCFGRKKTLIFSIVMIGLSTTLIGVLPTYASVGWIATLLLIFCRIFQGLAVGGEYITSVTFLVEHASPSQRGFMGSFAAFGVNSGNLIASLISCFIIYGIAHAHLSSYAWRIPFILTSIGIPIGLWIRRRNAETLPFIRENSSETECNFKNHFQNLLQLIKFKKASCVLIVALSALGTCATYLIYLYAPLHTALFQHLSQWHVMAINTFSLVVLVMLIPLFGYLSDRYTRPRLLTIACSIFVCLSYPFFLHCFSWNALGFFNHSDFVQRGSGHFP